MSKDYYKVLGVEKNATPDEIKKAFRKKAHEYHPDKKGGDEAKFKEINEAYQVLGDKQKKAQYDQYGSTFEQAQSQGGFQGFDGFRDFSGYANGFNVNMDDLGDIFGDLGDIFGFGGSGSSRTKTRAKRGADLQTAIKISFLEAVFGTEKEINMQKTVKCDYCQGSGAEPNSKIETCSECRGSGYVTYLQRSFLGNIQTKAECSKCGGTGKVFSQRCSRCNGAGITKKIIILKVKIPAGIDNGETIRLSGQGEAGVNGGPFGNLYIKVLVDASKQFERDGDDILTKLEINFKQAALGDKIEVNTVDGIVTLKIPAGIQSGTAIRLKGKGIPRMGGRGRGDQLVEVNIKIPTKLNNSQRKQIEELEL